MMAGEEIGEEMCETQPTEVIALFAEEKESQRKHAKNAN